MKPQTVKKPHPNSLKSDTDLAYEFLEDLANRTADMEMRQQAWANRN